MLGPLVATVAEVCPPPPPNGTNVRFSIRPRCDLPMKIRIHVEKTCKYVRAFVTNPTYKKQM